MFAPILLALAAAILLALTFGCDRRDDYRTSSPRDQGRDTPTATAPRTDAEFLTAAARANVEEIELGRLAGTKGVAGEVREFGRKMVDDHTQVNTRVKELAELKGVTLPTGPEEAARLEGPEFDQKYAALMVANHEKSVARYEKASKDAADADVRAFAGKTLPTIQHHLQMARDLKAKVGDPTAD